MNFKRFVSMNIAVIGVTKVVEEYAIRYAAAGHEVFIALKDATPEEVTSVARKMTAFENITICGIEEASCDADMIIIAALPKDVREIAYWLGDVRNRVIIDASANLQTVTDDKLNTANAIKAITGSQHIVKVFSTRGYEQLLKPLFGHDNVQLLMAGDSKKAKELVKILTLDLGVDKFMDLGGSDTLPLFNEMTAAWCKALHSHTPVPAMSVRTK